MMVMIIYACEVEIRVDHHHLCHQRACLHSQFTIYDSRLIRQYSTFHFPSAICLSLQVSFVSPTRSAASACLHKSALLIGRTLQTVAANDWQPLDRRTCV